MSQAMPEPLELDPNLTTKEVVDKYRGQLPPPVRVVGDDHFQTSRPTFENDDFDDGGDFDETISADERFGHVGMPHPARNFAGEDEGEPLFDTDEE